MIYERVYFIGELQEAAFPTISPFLLKVSRGETCRTHKKLVKAIPILA